LFGKKLDSHVSIEERFHQAFEKEKSARSQWLDSLKQAEEQRRLRVCGHCSSLSSTEFINAWEDADNAALEQQRRLTELQQQQRAAINLEKNWVSNTARWSMCAALDAAERKLSSLKQAQLSLIRRSNGMRYAERVNLQSEMTVFDADINETKKQCDDLMYSI
jgi:hypothetical protein